MLLKRITLITVLPLAAALGAVFVGVVNSSQGAGSARQAVVQIGDGQLSVLNRPRTPGDSLPASVLSSPTSAHFADPNAARLADAIGSRAIYVVPGTNDTMCLVVVEHASGITATDCADRTVLNSGGIVLTSPNPDQTENVVGVVSDNHASVQ